MSESSLRHRILNAVPAGGYEMAALLSLLKIEETRSIPTACVSTGRRPVFLINPDFVRDHCKTDEHLFLLVMHELHHVLLGHTRLFPRMSRAHNIALDAVINALLCARFPEAAYTSYFLGYYGNATGPSRLLAPPDQRKTGTGDLDALHELLYNDGSVTSEEVFSRIVKNLPRVISSGEPRLLGNHEPDDDWGTTSLLAKDVLDAIRKIVEKWPAPKKQMPGRNIGGSLWLNPITPQTPQQKVTDVLRRALLSATEGTRGSQLTTRRWPVPSLSAVPDPRDRRAIVASLAGSPPLLFQGQSVVSRTDRRAGARVYLDVSASVNECLPYLYGALSGLKGFIDDPVYLFSTVVTPIRLHQLAAGRNETTGGTDGTCVFEHALSTRARRIVVITDGYVGTPGKNLEERIRNARLDVRAVLTPGGFREDLARVCSRIDVLPELRNQRSAA
jgi:hypothetical protein